MIKDHKKEKGMPARLITSACQTPIESLGLWIQAHLSPLIENNQFIIKDIEIHY